MDFYDNDNGIRKYFNEVAKHLNTNKVANTNTIVFLRGMLTVSIHLLNQWEKVPENVRDAVGGVDPYRELQKIMGKVVDSDVEPPPRLT